jgi:hypothetical protein
MKINNNEIFIKLSNDKHKNKYDYKKVNFINKSTKVIITCKTHGDFEQTPTNHLMGKGCAYCAGVGKITKQIFLERVNLIHGDKYEYILNDEHIINTKNIEIICKTHGIFNQTSKNHLKGQDCPKCAPNYKYGHDEFIEKCKNIYGDKYDYSQIKYLKSNIKIKIICPEHGEFEQLPNIFLSKNACYMCSGHCKTTRDFIFKAKETHGDLYDYSKVNYTKSRESVIIICKIHGEFKQKPNDHLSGCGCNKCVCVNHSKVALRWLNTIEKELGYPIQHAGNKGEKKIKHNGKTYKFDGFDEKTNTVYEFFGTLWHGDILH